jgi:hypothetical protein
MYRPSLVRSLGDALLRAVEWPKDAELYLPVGREWSVDSPCIVVEDDRYTGVDPRIEHAGTEFAFALQNDQVQALLARSRHSLGRALTAEEASRVVLHYCRYETFVGPDEAP